MDLEAAAPQRALAEADRSRIAEYRVEQEGRIMRNIAAQAPSGLPRQGGFSSTTYTKAEEDDHESTDDRFPCCAGR
jgi:hypothetical protein